MFSLKKAIFPLSLIVSSVGTASFADELNQGFYVTAGIGAGNIGDSTSDPNPGAAANTTFGSGTTGEFGFGYDFGNDIRTEITYGTLSGDLTSFGAQVFTAGTASITYNSLNLNVFKDFSNNSKFTPYAGAGLSSTTMEVSQIDQVASGSASALGYNLKLGSSYEINDKSDFYGEFSYSKVGNMTVQIVDYSGLSSTSFNAGIRFRF